MRFTADRALHFSKAKKLWYVGQRRTDLSQQTCNLQVESHNAGPR